MNAITAASLRTNTTTTGTTPRPRLLINGQEQVGTKLVSFRVTQSRYGRGDTFTADVALQPGAATWFDPPGDANGEVAAVDARIEMGFLADGAPEGSCQWQPLFAGVLDIPTWQPARATVSIAGRDYLSKLRDLAVLDQWLNHTGPEILTLLIQAAGLTPDVQLPTAGIDGAFYQVEHKRLALIGSHRFSSAFDLARFLVNSASCDMWSVGKTVMVRPRDADTAVTTITYVPPGAQGGSAQFSGLDLTLERDLLIGRGVIVQVSSADRRQRKTHTWFISAKGAARTSPSSANAAFYAYSPPGLSDDQVKAFGQQRYAEILAHARKATIVMPGELNLTPRQQVRLIGTGSSYDTTYGIDQLDREWRLTVGFRQTLTCRTRVMPTDDGGEDAA